MTADILTVKSKGIYPEGMQAVLAYIAALKFQNPNF